MSATRTSRPASSPSTTPSPTSGALSSPSPRVMPQSQASRGRVLGLVPEAPPRILLQLPPRADEFHLPRPIPHKPDPRGRRLPQRPDNVPPVPTDQRAAQLVKRLARRDRSQRPRERRRR